MLVQKRYHFLKWFALSVRAAARGQFKTEPVTMLCSAWVAVEFFVRTQAVMPRSVRGGVASRNSQVMWNLKALEQLEAYLDRAIQDGR